MSWTDWTCLGVVVVGIVLFLYGSNYYDAVVGWFGVFLFTGGIAAYISLYIDNRLAKKPPPQNP